MDKAQKTILIVEDNPTNMRLLEFVLVANNYKLIQAFSGKQVIEIIETCEDKIDLIILDLQLPEINGFELIKVFKSETKTADVPIIVSSAHVMEEDVQKALELGGSAFLGKPIDIDALIKTIEELTSSNT